MSAVIVLIIRIALASVFYGFLGWALWVLWQDLRTQSDPNSVQRIFVEPIELYDVGAGQAYRFVIPQVNLGRDPASEFHVQDDSVSARHAQLSYHHGQWWVQDLSSRNGTFLNNEPVTDPLAMADGDELRFGGLICEVRLRRNGVKGRFPVYNDGDL